MSSFQKQQALYYLGTQWWLPEQSGTTVGRVGYLAGYTMRCASLNNGGVSAKASIYGGLGPRIWQPWHDKQEL
jgi:hypothetical protein